MKKFLSLVLVVALLVSMVSLTAFAADENVAKGKSYTISGCGTGYVNLEGEWPSDYDANLTDGLAEEELTFGTTKNWFGFYENGDNPHNSAVEKVGTAIIDLGSKVSGINKFRVHFGNHYANGVNSPEYAKIFVSADGTTYTEAGSLEIKDATVEANAVLSYWSEITLDTAVEARYVKLEVKLQGVFAFLNEIEVYAPKASGGNSGTTPPASKKTVTNLISKDLEWTATDVEYGGAVGKCTYSYDGDKLTVASDVNWPNITANLGDGIVVSGDDEIAVDFALTSGYVNFYVVVDIDGEIYALYIQHTIAPDNISASSGDLAVQGEYKTSFKIKDGVGSKSSVGAVPANCSTLPAADSYTIKSVTIMPCGGNASVTFNSFTVTSDAPVADEPANPGTGDATMVFALIALVAMAGAVVVSKKVR